MKTDRYVVLFLYFVPVIRIAVRTAAAVVAVGQQSFVYPQDVNIRQFSVQANET